MRRAEGKAEVQVTRPGHAFPFSTVTAPPHPHINQWCRFSVPERLPLKPFRQDRLNRLPLPPSIMATSKAISGTGMLPTVAANEKCADDIDPAQKILLLEKNLAFVQESHVEMLKGLHEEIADLKQKNRELIFEIVTGLPALPKDTPKSLEKDISEEQRDKIEKLEKEIRKLRGALKDAMKTNSSLSNQLQELRREQYCKTSLRNKGYSKTPPDSAIDDEQQIHSPCGPSPQMEDYSETLFQIQRAAAHRSGKREGRHRNDDVKHEWSEAYVRNGNGYHHHHHRQHQHHQVQKSPQQRQQQPRLPRLPLRNQQNYQHQHYEIQYRQRSSNTLPALKQPLVPVVDHRLDKTRKTRGPRPTKIADQAING